MAFFPGILTFFLSYCIQYCCSLITILYIILIILVLGFILSEILLFYFKQFVKIHYAMIIGIFLINIDFIILIIFTCLSIFKYFKFSDKTIEITQEKKKLLNKFSIIFSILSAVNIFLSIYCCCACYKMGDRQELILRIHSFLPVVIFYIIISFCVLSCLLWHSLHDFRGKIHGCENCCNCCCCKTTNNNKTNSNLIINIYNESNGVIFTSQTKVDEPKKEINRIDIHFFMSTGQKFLIKAPTDLNINKFFNYFFEILQIKKSDRANIFFLTEGQKLELDENTNYLLGNKFKSNIPILVIDQKRIINPIEETFIFN